MKHFLQLALVLILLSVATACNLSKTAVVRDTVKAVATTTADFYDFYKPGIGEGQMKDYNYTISKNKHNPDLLITIVPATAKQDSGYFIIKPAGSGATPTTITPDSPAQNEFTIRLGDFRAVEIPKRGN